MNLIPAGDRENFVLRIWNHYERYDSVRTSCLILFGAQTFLGVVSIVSLFPVTHFTFECLRSCLKYSAMAVISQDDHLTFGPWAACCVLSTLFSIVLERGKLALFCIISENEGFLSQNAAAKHQNQQLYISTFKGRNGYRFNEALKQLVMIPTEFRKMSFWKFVRCE